MIYYAVTHMLQMFLFTINFIINQTLSNYRQLYDFGRVTEKEGREKTVRYSIHEGFGFQIGDLTYEDQTNIRFH